VVDAAAADGVHLGPLGAHHLDPAGPHGHGVLVGWAGPAGDELDDALAVLTRVLAGVAPGPPGRRGSAPCPIT
ncbi:MAG: hypothetical protein K0S40_4426, partial [Actinomycetospora sp.]|nr:hypothetical protein [Actinomycetospora sp.]